MSHSHPTTSSVNCCKDKLATFLFHNRQNSNKVCFFLQFLFSTSFLESSQKNHTHQSYDRCTCCPSSDTMLSWTYESKNSHVFSTTGLLSYWGRLNSCFSEEETVQWGSTLVAKLLTQTGAKSDSILKLIYSLPRVEKSIQICLGRRGKYALSGLKRSP